MSIPPPDPTALPKYDFANQGSLIGLLAEFRNYLLKNTDDMLPATIIAYDRNANVATVQPAIHMVTTDGTLVGRASVASAPVLALGGGGFFVSFPLVPGSRGWIKANDRDISLYLQSSAAAAPNSQAMHSFSNGLFIPDIVSGYTLAGEDADNFVIQNLSGTVKVTLSGDTVRLFAPNIILDGAQTVLINSEAVTVNSPDITFSSDPHSP